MRIGSASGCVIRRVQESHEFTLNRPKFSTFLSGSAAEILSNKLFKLCYCASDSRLTCIYVNLCVDNTDNTCAFICTNVRICAIWCSRASGCSNMCSTFGYPMLACFESALKSFQNQENKRNRSMLTVKTTNTILSSLFYLFCLSSWLRVAKKKV